MVLVKEILGSYLTNYDKRIYNFVQGDTSTGRKKEFIPNNGSPPTTGYPTNGDDSVYRFDLTTNDIYFFEINNVNDSGFAVIMSLAQNLPANDTGVNFKDNVTRTVNYEEYGVIFRGLNNNSAEYNFAYITNSNVPDTTGISEFGNGFNTKVTVAFGYCTSKQKYTIKVWSNGIYQTHLHNNLNDIKDFSASMHNVAFGLFDFTSLPQGNGEINKSSYQLSKEDFYNENTLSLLVPELNYLSYGSNISNGTNNTAFGKAIDINDDGNVVVVGNETNNQITVFNYINNEWTQKGNIISLNNNYGNGVSINSYGNVIAISDSLNGNVKIYKFNGVDTWEQLGTVIDNFNTGDLTGFSMAFNTYGTKIVIGSPGYSNLTGLVRIFEYKYDDISDSFDWVRIGENIIGNSNSLTGLSVDINGEGNIIAFGCPTDDSNKGIIKIYQLINNEWIQMGDSIIGEISNGVGTEYGRNLKLSDNGYTIIFGSNKYNNDSNDNVGLIKIYQFINNNWVQKGSNITGFEGDIFGLDVSINDDSDLILFTSSQKIHIYYYLDNNWIHFETITHNKTNFGNKLIANKTGTIFGSSSYNLTNEPSFIKLYQLTQNKITEINLDSDIILSNNEIDTVIGNITTNTIQYSLDLPFNLLDNNKFKIVNNQLLANDIFDFENQKIYNIFISAINNRTFFISLKQIYVVNQWNNLDIIQESNNTNNSTIDYISDNGFNIIKNDPNTRLYYDNGAVKFGNIILNKPYIDSSIVIFDTVKTIPDSEQKLNKIIFTDNHSNTMELIYDTLGELNFNKEINTTNNNISVSPFEIVANNIDSNHKTILDGKLPKENGTLTGDLEFSSGNLILANNVRLNLSENNIYSINNELKFDNNIANKSIKFIGNNETETTYLKIDKDTVQHYRDLLINSYIKLTNDTNSVKLYHSYNTSGTKEITQSNLKHTLQLGASYENSDPNKHFLNIRTSNGSSFENRFEVYYDRTKVHNNLSISNSSFNIGGTYIINTDGSKLKFESNNLVFSDEIFENIPLFKSSTNFASLSNEFNYCSCVVRNKIIYINFENSGSNKIMYYTNVFDKNNLEYNDKTPIIRPIQTHNFPVVKYETDNFNYSPQTIDIKWCNNNYGVLSQIVQKTSDYKYCLLFRIVKMDNSGGLTFGPDLLHEIPSDPDKPYNIEVFNISTVFSHINFNDIWSCVYSETYHTYITNNNNEYKTFYRLQVKKINLSFDPINGTLTKNTGETILNDIYYEATDDEWVSFGEIGKNYVQNNHFFRIQLESIPYNNGILISYYSRIFKNVLYATYGSNYNNYTQIIPNDFKITAELYNFNPYFTVRPFSNTFNEKKYEIIYIFKNKFENEDNNTSTFMSLYLEYDNNQISVKTFNNKKLLNYSINGVYTPNNSVRKLFTSINISNSDGSQTKKEYGGYPNGCIYIESINKYFLFTNYSSLDLNNNPTEETGVGVFLDQNTLLPVEPKQLGGDNLIKHDKYPFIILFPPILTQPIINCIGDNIIITNSTNVFVLSNLKFAF